MPNNIELIVHHAVNITKTIFRKRGQSKSNWIDLVITTEGGESFNIAIFAKNEEALDKMSTQLGMGLVKQGESR